MAVSDGLGKGRAFDGDVVVMMVWESGGNDECRTFVYHKIPQAQEHKTGECKATLDSTRFHPNSRWTAISLHVRLPGLSET